MNILLPLIASRVQIYASYARDRNQVVEAVNAIEDGSSSDIADALWEYNFPLIEALLEGVYRKHGVQFVELTADKGRVWSLGEADQSTEFERDIQFGHQAREGDPRAADDVIVFRISDNGVGIRD